MEPNSSYAQGKTLTNSVQALRTTLTVAVTSDCRRDATAHSGSGHNPQ